MLRHGRFALRAEFGVAEDAPLLGHVGRFSAQKNHSGLLDIFAEVHRRRPDARYRISTKDIENCKLIQIKLIKTAAKLLKQGGRLVYSTCSIDKRENEDAPTEALKDFSDLRISSMKTHLPDEDSDGAGICVIERQI